VALVHFSQKHFEIFVKHWKNFLFSFSHFDFGTFQIALVLKRLKLMDGFSGFVEFWEGDF